MKFKKGFTLVEILVVIVLISLILGLGIPGIMKLNENAKKRSYNTKVDMIESAAVVWGNNNKTLLKATNCEIDSQNYDCYKISVAKLIEDEYLNSEEIGKIIYNNPETDDTLLNNCVYVYKKNNRVYANLEKNLIVGKCDNYNKEGQITTTVPAESPKIVSVEYKDYSDNIISKTTWTKEKKVFITSNFDEDKIQSYYYSTDGSNWFTFDNGTLLKKDGNIVLGINIKFKIKDIWGRESEVFEIEYNVDTVPRIPTANGGDSTIYATTRTIGITKYTTTYNTSTKYYYYVSNSDPTSSVSGTIFTNNSLTFTTNNIPSGSDSVKYLYLKACNDVGCSAWGSENLYLSKLISDYDTNCTPVSGKGCFYKGLQNGNYVKYGGEIWRLYQIDQDTQMHLILNDVSSTNKHVFSECKTNYTCFPSSNCNNLRDRQTINYKSHYNLDEIKQELDIFLNTLTATSNIKDYNYEFNTYNTPDTVNRSIGLMNYDEVAIIAGCTDLSCDNSYLDDVGNAWGLAEDNGSTMKAGNIKIGTNSETYRPYYHGETLKFDSKNSNRLIKVYGSYSAGKNNSILKSGVGEKLYIRPVIVLNDTSKFTSGDGSKDNPYVVG